MPLNHPQQEQGLRILGIGTDTEVFLQEIGTGKPIPVCGLLGGTKHEPKPVLTHIAQGFSVQEDNVMAEFNIPACTDVASWVGNLHLMRDFLQGHFRKQQLDLLVKPAAFFDVSQLNNRQAQTFGCEPDFDVWEMAENEIDTQAPILRKMRTAGGHIHVSFTKDGKVPELSDICTVVKALDVFLGVPSVLLDTDKDRRQVYGKAGAFRPKKYAPGVEGVEYRTLSNFWFRDAEYCTFVFRNVCQAFDYMNQHGLDSVETQLNQHKGEITETINGCLPESAKDFSSRYAIWMPPSWLNEQERTPRKSKKNLTTGEILAGLGVHVVGQATPYLSTTTILIDDLDDDDSEQN